MKSSVPKDARPGRALVKKGWFSMRYQITSDSTCDLSPELLQRYNIRLLPLYVNMDGKTLRDGVDVRPDDIYAHVSAGGGLPKTAAVNLADYVRMFTELSAQNDFVIHICISLDFSCCYQNAKLAAADFDNVYVVDSRNLSTGHGLVVLEAERMARAGMAPDEIVAALQELTGRVEASFILDRLDYMKMGGRCSAVTLLGANLLSDKTPEECIELSELKAEILESMKKLPPRERELIEYKFFKEKKLREISEEFNISQSRISRIIQSGLDKIKKDLKKQGII